ncbi:MAG: hypothetical protein ACC653_08575 [Gammaproteobacteria bacterium]
MNTVKKFSFSLMVLVLISLLIQPLQADEQANSDESSLHSARGYLSTAFKKYNDGDISAAKQNLKQASEWLNKAKAHSKSDKVKSEAEKLSSEIDSFRSTLKNSSEQHQNAMVRFWHRVTSLIKRESDHIIHSYTNSQNDNETLKYILNAKMNFYVAEHDLFVSYDSKGVKQELNNSLENLAEAELIAKPEIKTLVQKLIADIKVLVKLTESSKESWKKDKVVHSLDKAISNLTTAQVDATPSTILKLKLLEKDINLLKTDIQKTNLKNRYDSIMADFKRVASNI